jgi:hypothetical protein
MVRRGSGGGSTQSQSTMEELGATLETIILGMSDSKK